MLNSVTQEDFIWRLLNVNKITQTPDGIVIAELSKNIQIIHDYKKNNRMEVHLLDDKSQYIIDDKNSLDEILKIHLLYPNASYLIKEYAEKHLKKIILSIG